MKKLFVSIAFLFISVGFSYGQEIKFESLEIDYGKIDKGSNGTREFIFTNIGEAPLLVQNAQGSCGCTVPTWPKEPIMPGERSKISVKYDTQRVGAFTKYVTLTTNSKSNTSTQLKITGDVKPEAQQDPNVEKSLIK
jgi:hypothetical protein